MSEIWFTSDLHLGHDNIRKLASRPFNTLSEMNNALIANYNSMIYPEDTVYILGDLSFKSSKQWCNKMIARLNGNKVLILGNHDIDYDPDLFCGIYDYFEFKYQKIPFVLMHYPLMSWNKAKKGAFHVHGHIHSAGEYNERNRIEGIRRYDAGVDANGYYPVHIDEIIDFFQKKDKSIKFL